MDSPSAINIITLVISVAALFVSAMLARRQMKITASGNVVSVIIGLSNEIRTSRFVESRDYILNRLSKEHPPENGLMDLPEAARKHAVRVGGLFEDFGKLVAFRLIDERIVISSVGPTVIRTWEALKPYVYKQREIAGPQYWIFLENLAYRSTVHSAEKIRKKLRLKQFPESIRLSRNHKQSR